MSHAVGMSAIWVCIQSFDLNYNFSTNKSSNGSDWLLLQRMYLNLGCHDIHGHGNMLYINLNF